MATTISVSTASEAMIPGFMALSSSYYEDEPVNNVDVVRWRHLRAPGGPSATVELVDGEDRVGRMWVLRQRWVVDGEVVAAANPVDFLIREDHRKLPKFLSLFKATMREAHRDADIVFHTSNPLTDDLYRKLMKYEPATELDGAIVAVRPFALARHGDVVNLGRVGPVLDAIVSLFVRAAGLIGRLSGVRLSATADAADDDRIHALLREEEPIVNERSADHRSWRYRGAGPIRYERLWIHRRNRVVGCVVTSDRDVDGVRGRFVVDLVWPRPGRRWQFMAMWLQMAARASSDRRDALFFFYNRNNPRLASLAAFPMVTVRRERLPQRVPVFIRPSGSAAAGLDLVDWSTAYIVMADFDMF